MVAIFFHFQHTFNRLFNNYIDIRLVLLEVWKGGGEGVKLTPSPLSPEKTTLQKLSLIRVNEAVSQRWKLWCWCNRDEVSKTQSWFNHSHGKSPSWYWNFQNSRCYWWPSWSLTFERVKVGRTSLWTYWCTFQRGIWAWQRSLEEHAIVQTKNDKQTL